MLAVVGGARMDVDGAEEGAEAGLVTLSVALLLDWALTETKECDDRTTSEKSVRLRTAENEQTRMLGDIERRKERRGRRA